MEITEVQAMVENHLKDMILKSFDPKKADTIFTEEGKVRFYYFNACSIDLKKVQVFSICRRHHGYLK